MWALCVCRIAAGVYTGGQVMNVLIATLLGGFSLGQVAAVVWLLACTDRIQFGACQNCRFLVTKYSGGMLRKPRLHFTQLELWSGLHLPCLLRRPHNVQQPIHLPKLMQSVSICLQAAPLFATFGTGMAAGGEQNMLTWTNCVRQLSRRCLFEMLGPRKSCVSSLSCCRLPVHPQAACSRS